MSRSLLLAGAAALIFASPLAVIPHAGLAPVAIAATMAAPAAQDFVTRAGQANMFEIQSSQLALTKAQGPDVKKFAQKMIDDHTKAGKMMKAVVAKSGGQLQVPTDINADQKGTLDVLNSASGPDFDKQYVAAQVKAHDEAVALFSSYAKGGDQKALEVFARRTLPTLRIHRKMIHGISAKTA
jgi:putative membrane protein